MSSRRRCCPSHCLKSLVPKDWRSFSSCRSIQGSRSTGSFWEGRGSWMGAARGWIEDGPDLHQPEHVMADGTSGHRARAIHDGLQCSSEFHALHHCPRICLSKRVSTLQMPCIDVPFTCIKLYQAHIGSGCLPRIYTTSPCCRVLLCMKLNRAPTEDEAAW